MYADPLVLYREYIQNASDSIDAAVSEGILSTGEGQIEITLNPSERQVSIIDNGIGIESGQAEKTLISIGNSKKDSSASRGFRGIGRLSALSYCHKENDMSLRTFANKCGVSHAYISYIINPRKYYHNTSPVPSIEKYKKIAEAMGMDINQLLAALDESDELPLGEKEKQTIQILRKRPDLRTLLNIGINLTPAEVEAIIEMISKLKAGISQV